MTNILLQNRLVAAAYTGKLETVKLLLAEGADADAAGENGNMPLTAAASHGDIEIVLLLLDSGADKDKTGMGGNTAMNMAAIHGYTDIVQLLLERGASPEIKSVAKKNRAARSGAFRP